MPDFDGLPIVLAEIAEAAGIDAAWALARAYGGRHVYIPAKAKDDHWLVLLVGREAADAICGHYQANGNGTEILIPMAKLSQVRALVDEAIAAGMTASEAAGYAGVHERTIWRQRKNKREARPRKKRPDGRQSSLF